MVEEQEAGGADCEDELKWEVVREEGGDKMDEDDIIFTMLVLQCCAVMLDLTGVCALCWLIISESKSG